MNTTEIHTYSPEAHLALETPPEMPPGTAEAIGSAAVDGALTADEVDSGIDLLGAYANSQDAEIDAAHEEALRRNEMFDADEIDAAHEEAIHRNEIFDLHEAALFENKIFDAHAAALDEDKERSKLKVQQEGLTQALPQSEQPAAKRNASFEQVSRPLTPISAGELRRQALSALAEAGFTTQPPANSIISREPDGRLVVVHGNSAEVIARLPNGNLQVTEYAYDEGAATLTVTTNRANVVTGHIVEYEPTTAKDWQTHKTVVPLPPILAKRFGFERAVVVESEAVSR